MKVAILVCFSLTLLSRPLGAAPIYAATGNVDANPAIMNTGSSVQFVAGSWSQAVDLTNVTLEARINGSGTLVAYLTTRLGPGTTVADQIAISTFSVGGAPQSNFSTIFTGLSLPANTYYLTIAQSAVGPSVAAWVAALSPTITGSPDFMPLPAVAGSFADNTYLPASSFSVDTRLYVHVSAVSTFSSGILDGAGTLNGQSHSWCPWPALTYPLSELAREGKSPLAAGFRTSSGKGSNLARSGEFCAFTPATL
jgi:hypothetical protein